MSDDGRLRAEFMRRVVARVRVGWPHSQFPDATAALMWDTLKDLPVDQVATTIEVLLREGREHAPTGGMIRAKVVELSLDAPSWAEVKRQILDRAVREEGSGFRWACPANGCDGDGWRWVDDDTTARCECYEQMVKARRSFTLEGCHPLVAEFVRLVGLGAVVESVDDTTAEAQCRTKWDRFVAGERDRDVLRGLPSAGLARLERVNSAPRRLGVALKQIDQGAER